jgi:hypothetical protein
MFDNTFVLRVVYKLACGLVAVVCLVCWGAALARAYPSLRGDTEAVGVGWGRSAQRVPHHHEPPADWRPLALTEVEQRFARQFPGTLTRLTNEHDVLVLRAVHRPTRMLHPAPDCYRGLGYRVTAQRLQLDGQHALWRCFEARRGAQQLRVCEHIVDAEGRVFTDTSSWYWSALLGESRGPWQAFTVASPL